MTKSMNNRFRGRRRNPGQRHRKYLLTKHGRKFSQSNEGGADQDTRKIQNTK